ncbi:glycosyltransferase family 2 protein [Polynucleobacter sp. 30F-ANTBAC]|jgi:glycosyltransferase involved in cell wall biosynthesis|uniref:glycosyltransferase family 2 protein n=1 Tax=Polynucleobacter sp. 30F-ANTBAC TaxID=2689095 RepID=UPI001C0E1A09|nr:glycosyltransferase family 2 protein [Polynucleobacter sp. 30F-ANTBAC]MBU3599565.1 glycosyltransferase family 2 protein [Polynucleobacter sp. 30F-ANTBAC]
MGLSVILITKNEEANLKDCLESVSFANEIIIVDSQSTDQTISIAQSFGAKVEITPDWPGFGPQKNRALDLATQDWVLSIDADERVTPELKKEILEILTATSSQDCYAIPRSSWYCGRFMKYSGWYPDYVDRLFKRGTAKFSDHLVHERLLPNGAVGHLKNHFLHYSYRNFEQVLKKVDTYSTAAALQAFKKGQTGSLTQALLHGFWAFFRTYIVRKGFLDGQYGLALAISNGATSYYKYIKLWQLGNPKRKN